MYLLLLLLTITVIFLKKRTGQQELDNVSRHTYEEIYFSHNVVKVYKAKPQVTNTSPQKSLLLLFFLPTLQLERDQQYKTLKAGHVLCILFFFELAITVLKTSWHLYADI